VTQWIRATELEPQRQLVGLRVRYKGEMLGFLRSAWERGLWITPDPPEDGRIIPWFSMDGSQQPRLISEILGDLEFEVQVEVSREG